MNVVGQYLVAIVGTVIAQFLVMWSSNAVAGLGMMMSAAIHTSASPKFRRDLQSGEVNSSTIKGLLRSQLIGALPSAVAAILLCLLFGGVLGYYVDSAAWIPGLWMILMILYSLTLIRQSLWWLIKSFFVPPGRIADEMAAWQAKHS